jgi:hypothetical protein
MFMQHGRRLALAGLAALAVCLLPPETRAQDLDALGSFWSSAFDVPYDPAASMLLVDEQIDPIVYRVSAVELDDEDAVTVLSGNLLLAELARFPVLRTGDGGLAYVAAVVSAGNGLDAALVALTADGNVRTAIGGPASGGRVFVPVGSWPDIDTAIAQAELSALPAGLEVREAREPGEALRDAYDECVGQCVMQWRHAARTPQDALHRQCRSQLAEDEGLGRQGVCRRHQEGVAGLQEVQGRLSSVEVP